MRTLLLPLLLALGLPAAHARGDHPEVPSYPGAKIQGYDYKEFEEAQLVLSKPTYVAGRWHVDKLLPVDGKVTYLRYEMEKTVSALQVFRNYQSSLARSGFKELFVCERPCLGDGNLEELRVFLKGRDLTYWANKDVQYLSAQRGNTYVSLGVGYWSGSPQAYLFVIEKGQMDTGLMAVSGASAMAQALSAQGKVDVYGFLFDSGKAQLKPGSAATLGELAQVLRDNPQLRIQLIGHTDDVGGAEPNQLLSLARAQAVSAALISEQGIAPDRLQADGKGAAQPLAPNSDEAARARNRRVEIVALQPLAPTKPGQAQAQPQAPTRTAAAQPGAAPSGKAADPEKAIDTADKAANTANKVLNTADKLMRLFGR
jgi:outer membrane protein OmpA-like peptidoglycan-associated protein